MVGARGRRSPRAGDAGLRAEVTEIWGGGLALWARELLR